MKELQDHAEHLQCENDLLYALVEKRHNLGGRDVQDSDQALHPIPRNRGKEPIILNEVDTPADDELSSGSSPPLGLSPAKNIRAKLHKKTTHRPAFSNGVPPSKERGMEEVVPTKSSPRQCVSIAYGRDAINVVCTSRLQYKADILHAASSSNSGTRRHAFFAPRPTHS